ncbi:MAG TPA: cytochrome c oxidase subunit II [Herpetosiphonaceae bacterium]
MPKHRHVKAPLRSAIFLILLAGLLAACGQAQPQTTLSPSSESTRTIFDLSVLLFLLGAGVFVIVEGILIYSIVKYRHRYDEQLPAQIHGNTKVEIAWTLLPAIVATGIFVVTFQAMQRIEVKPTGGEELRVQVIGHQWWWEFRYPDIVDDRGQPLVTANEMWVPADRVIDLEVTSVDVIHDFWIPGLSGKRDAIPNRENSIWFKADSVPDGAPQTFWGQCAEYCGTQHAYMKMRVIVASPADFERWRAENVAPAVTQNPTAEQLFLSKSCGGCHAIKGVNGAVGVTGPNLTHVGARQTLAAGTIDNTRENLHAWLDDPNFVKRGNLMAVQIKDDTLSPEELDILVDYLGSLK